MTHRACAAVEPLLSGWTDGELEAGEAAQVAAHLEVCPQCVEVATDIADLRDALRGLPARRLPTGLVLRCRHDRAGGLDGADGREEVRSAVRSAALLAGAGMAGALLIGVASTSDVPVRQPLETVEDRMDVPGVLWLPDAAGLTRTGDVR